MAEKSKIEWTDATWSPVVGCSKVSEGCNNCYAERMACRLAKIGYQKFVESEQYNSLQNYCDVVDSKRWNGAIAMRPNQLDKPLHWKKPRRIFVCSMGDLFHPKVPFEFIDRVWGIAAVCPQHIFQWLTKRPEVMKEYFERCRKQLPEIRTLKNLWLGTSVENQPRADERIPILLQIPVAVRFVSCEPLLEEVNVANWGWRNTIKGMHPRVDWLIIGCESGPKRRPCKLEWVRDLVKQCKDAGVPVFIKQLDINGKVEHDINKFPKDLQIREYPKNNKEI